MHEDIIKQKIMQEFQKLKNDAQKSEQEVSIYLQLMKERILDTYCAN